MISKDENVKLNNMHKMAKWSTGQRSQWLNHQLQGILEACFDVSSASSQVTRSEDSQFVPVLDLSNLEEPGCSKTTTKVGSNDDPSL